MKTLTGPSWSRSSPNPVRTPVPSPRRDGSSSWPASSRQRVDRRHHLHPGPQRARLTRPLVRRELARCVPDPAGRHAAVGQAGQALAGVLRGDQVEGPLDGRDRVRQHHVAHQAHRAFLENSRRTSGLVEDDPATLHRLADVGLDADLSQGDAVQLARVAGRVLDPHRTASAHPVQVVAVGLSPVQQNRIEARSDQPVVRPSGTSVPFQDAVEVVDRADLAEVDLQQAQAGPDAVRVRVVEPRQHHPAARVDVLAGLQAVDVRPHGHHPAVQRGHRVHDRPGRVTGVDPRVAHDQVDEHALVLSHPTGVGGPVVRWSGAA